MLAMLFTKSFAVASALSENSDISSGTTTIRSVIQTVIGGTRLKTTTVPSYSTGDCSKEQVPTLYSQRRLQVPFSSPPRRRGARKTGFESLVWIPAFAGRTAFGNELDGFREEKCRYFDILRKIA
jgi:hypothetical protein